MSNYTIRIKMEEELMYMKSQLRSHSDQLRKLKKWRRRMVSPRFKMQHLLWSLVCIAGYVFQAYHITDLYLKYEINAEYLNYPMDLIQIPSLAVCFDKPFKHDCSRIDCSRFLETSRSFFDNVHEMDYFFTGIVIMRPDGKREIFHKFNIKDYLEKVTTLIKLNSWLCLHMKPLMYINENYTGATLRKVSFPLVFSLGLESPYDSWNVEEMPMFIGQGQGANTLLPQLKQGNVSVVSYERKELNLLEHPFRTDCRHYRQETQYMCLVECIIETSLKNGGMIPSGTAYSKIDDNRFNTSDVDMSQLQFGVIDSPICEKKCNQLSCQIISYEPKVTAYVNVAGQTGLAIQLPSRPGIIINYKPKLDLTEYLTLIGSGIGLWFGLSAFSLIDMVDFVSGKKRTG